MEGQGPDRLSIDIPKSRTRSQSDYLIVKTQINAEDAIVAAAMENIDAEYAALVADYSLVPA